MGLVLVAAQSLGTGSLDSTVHVQVSIPIVWLKASVLRLVSLDSEQAQTE